VTDILSTQLNHSDPLERRKAIVALANRDDRAALDAVTRAALTDHDPAVRELASKAQAHLSKKLNIDAPQAAPNVAASAPVRPAPQKRQPTASPQAQPTSKAPSVEVSAEDIAAAKGQLLNAYGARASGDRYGAQIALSRAFVFNPALREDPEVRELAAEVTGLDGSMAVVRLTMPPPGKSSGHGGSAGNGGDGANGGRAVAGSGDSLVILFVEYAIYFALVVFVTMISLNLARQSSEFVLSSMTSTARNAQSQRLLTAFLSTSGPAILTAALGFAAISLIGLILWNVLVQLFCNVAMGGVAGFIRHQNAVFRVTIATTLVYAVVVLIWALTLKSPPQTVASIGELLNGIILINSLVAAGAQIYLVSRVHQFDMVRGFVGVVLTPLIFACLCGVCLFASGIANRLTM